MARDLENVHTVILVCHGSDCKKAGAKKLAKAARECARTAGKRKETMVIRTRCTGQCKRAPIVSLQPQRIWLTDTTEDDLHHALKKAFKDADK